MDYSYALQKRNTCTRGVVVSNGSLYAFTLDLFLIVPEGFLILGYTYYSLNYLGIISVGLPSGSVWFLHVQGAGAGPAVRVHHLKT